MKRLAVVLIFICALCVPSFAGHIPVGGYGYCECMPVKGVCPCCGSLLATASPQEDESISQNVSDCSESTPVLGAIRTAFLMWLKLEA